MTYRAPNEASHCPSCDDVGIVPLDFFVHKKADVGGHRVSFISGCSSCGLIFVNPPPDPQEIAATYGDGGVWQQRLERRARQPAEDLARVEALSADYRALFVREAEGLRPTLGGSRVLDFGCGPGKVLDALQDAGWDTTGLEPLPSHVITRHKMISSLPQQPSFDLIIMKQVLEHVPKPLATLKQVRRCISESGRLMISTPTLDGLRQHGRKKYCINRSHHFITFTRRTLVQVLGLAGFEIERAMPEKFPFRMGLIARPGNPRKVYSRPLRDARKELRGFAADEQGRLYVYFTSTRRRAAAVAKVKR